MKELQVLASQMTKSKLIKVFNFNMIIYLSINDALYAVLSLLKLTNGTLL